MKNPTLENDAGFGDEALMDELLRHDAQAFEKLFWRHRSVLRGVVLRVVNDECEADDVLQEVFVHLWTQAKSYSSEKGKPLGWMITLARRRAIDRLRQRSAYRRATDRLETEMQHPTIGMDDSRTGELAACEEDRRALVHGAMLRLPSKQRDVVTRVFFDGLSQREIAANMHIPLGTVKTRIKLGLRKLLSVLAVSRAEIF